VLRAWLLGCGVLVGPAADTRALVRYMLQLRSLVGEAGLFCVNVLMLDLPLGGLYLLLGLQRI
jgi:hypothetical protein